jgi:hypothetical protein
MAVAKGIVGVCKVSQSKSMLELPTLCGEGKHMMQMT